MEDAGEIGFAILFRQSNSNEKRAEFVVHALAKRLARSLSTSPNDIDVGRPLFDYGVDSLVAVELRNWVGKKFVADIAVFDIMGGATIREIGVLVSKKTTIEVKTL